MKKVIILLLLFASLVVFFFIKNSRSTKVQNNSHDQYIFPIKMDQPNKVQINKIEPSQNTESVQEIINCLSQNQLTEYSASILALIQDANLKFENQEFVFSNIHVQIPNGETRRIQLSHENNAEGKQMVLLKYFSETEEGLPWPVAIPKEDQINPSTETINKYTSSGKIIFSQTQWQTKLNNNELVWTETNGSIQDLEFMMGSNILNCAKSDKGFECQCVH